MSFNDPIADLLTKIRNAAGAKHRYVDFRLSRAKLRILEILKEKGFIENFLLDNEQGRIRVFLKYRARRPVIHGLKRVSTPGMRRYVNSRRIPKVQNGLGIAILSTSKGVMDGETARQNKVGGELWCTIW